MSKYETIPHCQNCHVGKSLIAQIAHVSPPDLSSIDVEHLPSNLLLQIKRTISIASHKNTAPHPTLTSPSSLFICNHKHTILYYNTRTFALSSLVLSRASGTYQLPFWYATINLEILKTLFCAIKNMPIISGSGNLALSLKVAVISTSVLSVGVMLKLSVPLISDFVASDVPSFWNVILQWLKPPYLYLIINGIIISIVASSKLQQNDYHMSPEISGATDMVVAGDVRTGYVLAYDDVGDLSDISTENNQGVYRRVEERNMVGMKAMTDGGDEIGVVEKSLKPPQRSDSMEFSDSSEKEKDKPPISARFGHRKAGKASPEGGKALRVSKSKRHDTLEITWKTITEGRAMPLTRHLKKTDTWGTRVRQNNTPAPKMKKAETFYEGTTTSSNNSSVNANTNSGRLKREPSLSQDELNRRVEAFIKKFNEEMRLQRQRSLEQYNQMISGGVN